MDETHMNGKAVERFVLPETTLKELLQILKKIFPGNAFNVTGNPGMKVTVWFIDSCKKPATLFIGY
ncbi:MAG: hypothetical protein E4H43_02640 [Bacteroidia bacterium]|nr:MAG: hypothetical protein E4H43_02640 [Bacteroidia bacterium]